MVEYKLQIICRGWSAMISVKCAPAPVPSRAPHASLWHFRASLHPATAQPKHSFPVTITNAAMLRQRIYECAGMFVTSAFQRVSPCTLAFCYALRFLGNVWSLIKTQS